MSNTPNASPRIHDMQIERVPIDSVRPYPGNPRIGHRPTLDESLGEHGLYKSIGVQRSTGYIVFGNNTWHALRDVGATEVAVHYLDIDDERAKRINLVDNRANDKATYDNRALLEFTADLDTLEGTGYDPGDLDDIRASLEEATDDLAEDDETVSQRKGMQEKYDSYENSDQRQIVLQYVGDQYVWMVEQLAELGMLFGLDSNAAVVLRLVEQATEHEAPTA